MKRESTFYLVLAIIVLASIIGVMVTWALVYDPNDIAGFALRIGFYVFALIGMVWNLKIWAEYRLREDRERTNKKG